MRRKLGSVVASMTALLVVGAAAMAETKVEVKDVHLCCGACVKGVAAALKGMEGVTHSCDRDDGTVTITAADDATAQKSLDALADAGYHGAIDSKTLTIKSETNVPQGKVKSLNLNNTHNCCKSCTVAIQKAARTVAGVSGDTVKPKTAAFEVTGDFEAAALVKALNDAGFHVQVKP